MTYVPIVRIGAERGAVMDWSRMLAYVTGTVDQELLVRNEYLAAENRILKAQLNGRLKLSDGERKMLGDIGHRWAARLWPKSLPLPDRTPSWAGTASLSPTSSMARRSVGAQADRGSSERSSS